jgi:hypothetical protein
MAVAVAAACCLVQTTAQSPVTTRWVASCTTVTTVGTASLPDRRSTPTAACGWAVAAPARVQEPVPVPAGCASWDVSCQLQQKLHDVASAGVRDGLLGLADLAVQGMGFVLSKIAAGVFTDPSTSMIRPDAAFYSAYNAGAGIMIGLVAIFFLISLIIGALRTSGPGPVATLGGLVRAVLGISLAGGIAWTITQAWDQATASLIGHFASKDWDAGRWIGSITALSAGTATTLLAIFVAFLSLIGLLLVWIMLVFRSVLATGAALVGSMAMAGQAMPETRHWSRRWFWTVNALASSKFFIALLWIYATRQEWSADDLTTSVQAMLMIWLMVFIPVILLRLTAIWDGYLADVDPVGVWQAAGRGIDRARPGQDDDEEGDGKSDPGDRDRSPGEHDDPDAGKTLKANSVTIPTTPDADTGTQATADTADGEGASTGESGEPEPDDAADDDGAEQPDPDDDEERKRRRRGSSGGGHVSWRLPTPPAAQEPDETDTNEPVSGPAEPDAGGGTAAGAGGTPPPVV